MVENNNCKALLTTNRNSKLPSKPQISYFLTINFTTGGKSRARNEPSTKVRIKIPKLLAKTVKKKEAKQSDENNINVKKPLVQKVTSLFSNAFGRKKKKLLENNNDITFVSEIKSGDRSKNASSKEEGFGSDIQSHENNSDEIFFYENCESENSKLFVSTTTSMSSSDDLSFSEQRVSLASKSSVSESPCGSTKESLEIEDEEEVKPVQLINPSYLTSSFNKRTPLQIIRSTISTRKGGNSCGGDRGIKRISSFPAGALKFLMIKQKSRRGYSSGKEMNGKEEEADEEKGEGYELCKKQILMGGRCRPLSFPCSPHNGIGISSTRDFPIRTLNSD